MGLSADLTVANWNDFNPLHLALAGCPFFLRVFGHRIKSHILKVPNSVIILASQSTCNWPIKLPRKNWQLYPSKYGNPHSNCTEVEGSGLHPHFRNEETEEEVARPHWWNGSQEPKCACFQTRAFCYAEPGRREPSLGVITSPWGHSPIRRVWCAHWSMVSSAVGRFQQQLRFQNAFSGWITPGSSPPSCGITQNDCTQCEISSNN